MKNSKKSEKKKEYSVTTREGVYLGMFVREQRIEGSLYYLVRKEGESDALVCSFDVNTNEMPSQS